MSQLSDQLEAEFGTAILEELTGESLTRKGQSVRLFDQTGRTAERYYPEDNKGVPHIYDHAQGKSWYPITAYCAYNNVDWKTAFMELSERYLDEEITLGKPYTAQRSRPEIIKPPTPPTSYHDPRYVIGTIGNYERNNFAIYLQRLLGIDDANSLLSRFGVGTGEHWHISQHWPRTTIFWQMDEQSRVHGGKVIYYAAATGRRIKERGNEHPPTWVHSLKSLPSFHYKPCFFGLHQLITEPTSKPIAVVESEKSAIICTAFMPGFIWLATGGLGNLNADLYQVLKGRTVTLFPDLKCFSKWEAKAEQINKVVGCQITVSPILERMATTLERDAGYDLADYLTRYRCPNTGRVLNEPDGYPALWDAPSPPGIIPTIRTLSVNQYLSKPIEQTV